MGGFLAKHKDSIIQYGISKAVDKSTPWTPVRDEIIKEEISKEECKNDKDSK